MDVPVSQSKNRINLLLLISLFITQLDSGIMSTNLSSISRTFALSPQKLGGSSLYLRFTFCDAHYGEFY